MEIDKDGLVKNADKLSESSKLLAEVRGNEEKIWKEHKELFESFDMFFKGSNTVSAMQDILKDLQLTVTALVATELEIRTKIEGFNNAGKNTEETIDGLGGWFGNLFNPSEGSGGSGSLNLPIIGDLDFTSGIGGFIASIIPDNIEEIIGGVVGFIAKGLYDLLSSLTGFEDSEAEKNINEIVAKLIEMMNAIEIQDGISAAVGLLSPELAMKTIGVLGQGVGDIIGIISSISTGNFPGTLKEVQELLANLVGGAAEILGTDSVKNVIEYFDDNVVTIGNAIKGLEGIQMILDKYSNNQAIAATGEVLQITQGVADVASYLLGFGINILKQDFVYNLVDTVDKNVINIDNGILILNNLAEIIRNPNPTNVIGILMQTLTGVFSGINPGEIISSLIDSLAGLIAGGDLTSENMGDLLPDVLINALSKAWGEDLSGFDLVQIVDEILSAVGITGIRGDAVFDFVKSLLTGVLGFAGDAADMLGGLGGINLEDLPGSLSGIIDNVLEFVSGILGGGDLEGIVGGPEAINGALGFVEDILEPLVGDISLVGVVDVAQEVIGFVSPIITTVVGGIVGTLGEASGEDTSKIVEEVVNSLGIGNLIDNVPTEFTEAAESLFKLFFGIFGGTDTPAEA